MRFPREGIDIISALQTRVDEILKHNQDRASTSTPAEDLPRIQNWLHEMLKLYPNFKSCEEYLTTKFKSLEIDIYDEILLHDLTPKDKVDEKLKLISEKIESIKLFMSKIQLPPPDEPFPAPLQPTQSGVSAQAQGRLESKDWERLEVEEMIQDSPAIINLQRSYDVLDLKLKICLLCFAVFPENVVIKKKPVIFWWIAEGLITKSKDKTVEEVGEGIFRDLIKEGMIQPCPKTQKNPIVDCCTIHPWIRRMLISVARREEFFDIDKEGKIENYYFKSRRSCLLKGSKEITDSAKEEELLTLFNVNEQNLIFEPEFFFKFKKLMILQLGRWQNSTKHHIEVENEEFLEELHAQKHLKYLSLHGLSRITHLPSSIVECSSLEILDLRACHNLEKLPYDIESFIKLTHFDVSDCLLLETMPKGIEKLYSLQVLKGFVIGQSRKNACKLNDLAQLKKLRKLSIHIRNGAVVEGGELEKLKDFESLCILAITWGEVILPQKTKPNSNSITNPNSNSIGLSYSLPQLTRTTTMIMESFSFPPNLEKLDLRRFPLKLSPKWLNATNLKKLKRLYIRGGELQNLGTVSVDYWQVKILRVKYLRNLKVTANKLVKVFPRLSYFEKVRCNQINSEYEIDVEWNEKEGLEALKSRLPNTDGEWNEE